MDTLVLDSLLIENFRSFKKLQIPALGKVNLIVGRNSIGKTCILEALRLYARRGNPSVIWEILANRDEYNFDRNRNETSDEAFTALSYMFYGREEIKDNSSRIQIGSLNNPKNILSIGINYYALRINPENNGGTYEILSSDELLEAENPSPRFTFEFNDHKSQQTYPIDPNNLRVRLGTLQTFEEIPVNFVPSSGITRQKLPFLWDTIALTELEEDVSLALRVIDNEIERITMITDRETRPDRYPIVRKPYLKKPLPLRSLGDGMIRALGIALSLVNAQNGFLLIDEFENGLHYSIQLDLWRLIFRTANKLNVQVFATSHSWDCIEAFQKASLEDEQQQGMLIRLEKKKDEITPVLFDERKLSIATREHIEVR